MACAYVKDRFGGFSNEKKKVVAMAVDNVIACPLCKKVHPIWREEDEELS